MLESQSLVNAQSSNQSSVQPGHVVLREIDINLFDLLKEMQTANIISVSSHELLVHALRNGGFIAGGFARYVALHVLGIQRYDRLHFIPRDIDVFFTSAQTANELVQRALDMNAFTLSPSPGKFAINIVDSTPKAAKLKLQFVTNLISPSIQACLDAFDFTNVAVALTESKMFVPETWESLERAHQLDVKCIANNYVFKRIWRYLHSRNLNVLSPNSSKIFQKYIHDNSGAANFLTKIAPAALHFVLIRKYLGMHVLLLLTALGIDDDYKHLEKLMYARLK